MAKKNKMKMKGRGSMRFVLYQVLCSAILLRASVQVHSLFSPATKTFHDAMIIRLDYCRGSKSFSMDRRRANNLPY
jgi:hypothetical protein